VQADSIVFLGSATGAVASCGLHLPVADVAAWEAATPRGTALPAGSRVSLRWRTLDMGSTHAHIGAVVALDAAPGSPLRLLSAGADGRVLVWPPARARGAAFRGAGGDSDVGCAALEVQPFPASAACLACCPARSDAFLV
jgi:hypothetical protein